MPQNYLEASRRKRKLKAHELMAVKVDDQGRKYLEVHLTQGKVAMADIEDFEAISKFKWCLCQNRPTAACYAVSKQKKLSIRMHRLILNCPPSKQVDHINGNGLDNRRFNLRICTNSQNHFNTKMYKNNPSGFKGVYFHKLMKKWQAKIMKNGKEYRLGYFKSAIEAAMAYDKKALKLHGQFAFCNLPKNES